MYLLKIVTIILKLFEIMAKSLIFVEILCNYCIYCIFIYQYMYFKFIENLNFDGKACYIQLYAYMY